MTPRLSKLLKRLIILFMTVADIEMKRFRRSMRWRIK
jgi:hypothetical protein